MFQTTALLLLSVYTAVSGAQTPLQSAYLDGQERFYIEWQYTDTNITILAKVKTTGWFGIGFSTNGGMAGADIITASVVNGVPHLQDRYAEKNGYPLIDQSQDVELLSGSEVDGVTTIQFSRKHNTCDDKDMIVGTDTMRVIYAISPDGSDTLSYHTPNNRGTKSVFLRRKFTLESNIPDDIVTFNITMIDVEIEALHTMYHCELMRAPKFKVKHHLIKAEPLIQKENMGIVHHAVVYGCYDTNDREYYFNNNNTGFDCLAFNNMPPDLQKCKTAIVAWGIGGGPTFYPEEAGYPFGGDGSPDYIVIEMHYDNPQLLSGRRDSSGFRLIFTPTLRKYDAGILGIGAVNGIAIPPNAKDFVSAGFCSKTCTKGTIKNDLNIFGSFLHGHLSTTQIIARQFRDGKELDVVDEDRHYDFNYQQYKSFEKPIILKPGDEMMVQCHHNTEDRVNMTFGGLPSASEMCIAFLSYYPAGDLDYCESAPGWTYNPTVSRNFVRNNLGYTEKEISNNFIKDFTQITDDNLWSEKRVESLQNGYYDLPHMDICLKRAFVIDANYRPGQHMPTRLSKQPPPARKYEKECSAVSTDKPDVVVG